MYTVDVSEYPQSREWSEKVHSTPSIPGGKNRMISNLRTILLSVRNGGPFDQIPRLEVSGSKSTLNDLCVQQLSTVRLVERSADGGWKVSEEAEKWLASEDDLYLAACFCAQVKFFAEILYYLDSPKTARSLFRIAVEDYDMTWKTTSTLNNRLVWLRQFGLVSFQEFSLLYAVTEKGKNFLKTVNPILPESLAHGADDTISETELVFNEPFVEYYKENQNAVRKAGFGYFPGGINDYPKTMNDLLTEIRKDGEIEAITAFAFKRYQIKESSVRSALNTVSALGLIARKSNTAYAVTDLGLSWLENPSVMSLLPLFQLRYLFFFEILTELKGSVLSAKELAAIAKVSYGFEKENVVEINNRAAILKQAKLVMNLSAEKLALTHRGELLLEQYGGLFGIVKKNAVSKSPEETVDIITELRMASKDSYNPDRFEKDVRDFFSLIGFEAEWLGGAGNTDVLLKTPGTPFDSFVVTVDAKTTSSAAVSDGMVDFDTLKEHRKKHGSDYIAVIGRGFNNRLIQRAREHHVVLFDMDSLETLLRIRKKTPQKLTVYRKVFEQSGKADLSVLEADVQKSEKAGSLLVEIMRRLIAECEDPITKGQLTVRDLYMSLRVNPAFSAVPSIEEIENGLQFLSSPIVGCVAKEKEFYYATGSLKDMARIFRFLEEKCEDR